MFITKGLSLENYSYLQNELGIIHWGMKVTGIWPMKNRFENVKFSFCTLSMCVATTSCVYGTYRAKNIETFIECLLYTIVMFFTLIKLLITKAIQKNLRVLLQIMANDAAQYDSLPDSCKKSITSNVRRRKIISKLLIVFLCSSVVAYSIQTYDMETKSWEAFRETPFFSMVPSKILYSTLFYPVIVVVACGCLVWITVIVTIDSIFAIVMVHATNQFMILSDKLRRYNAVRPYSCNNDENLLQNCDCLRCIISGHIHTLRFLREAERAFYILLLVEMSRNLIHFGIQIHNLIWLYKINNFLKLMHVGIILFSMNLHLFLYCATAKNMTEAGEQMCVQTFMTNWYDFHPEVIRSIMLIMLKCQQPCHVTVAKFVNLSLETYRRVLTTSFSYASVILATRSS